MSRTSPKKQRSISATDAEWEQIRRQANRAGIDSVSLYVVNRLTENQATAAPPAVPAPAPQAHLPLAVQRRLARDMIVMSRLLEDVLLDSGGAELLRRLRNDADDLLEREGVLG